MRSNLFLSFLIGIYILVYFWNIYQLCFCSNAINIANLLGWILLFKFACVCDDRSRAGERPSHLLRFCLDRQCGAAPNKRKSRLIGRHFSMINRASTSPGRAAFIIHWTLGGVSWCASLSAPSSLEIINKRHGAHTKRSCISHSSTINKIRHLGRPSNDDGVPLLITATKDLPEFSIRRSAAEKNLIWNAPDAQLNKRERCSEKLRWSGRS